MQPFIVDLRLDRQFQSDFIFFIENIRKINRVLFQTLKHYVATTT